MEITIETRLDLIKNIGKKLERNDFSQTDIMAILNIVENVIEETK